MFILSEERDENPRKAFDDYECYLQENKTRLTPNVFSLATSDWYFNFQDHRCPHDGRLIKAVMLERTKSALIETTQTEDDIHQLFQDDTIDIRIQLVNAWGDGVITLDYLAVHAYRLSAFDISGSHDDWRYDEFRLSENGFMLHEIEWRSFPGYAVWEIEAEDIQYRWTARTVSPA